MKKQIKKNTEDALQFLRELAEEKHRQDGEQGGEINKTKGEKDNSNTNSDSPSGNDLMENIKQDMNKTKRELKEQHKREKEEFLSNMDKSSKPLKGKGEDLIRNKRKDKSGNNNINTGIQVDLKGSLDVQDLSSSHDNKDESGEEDVQVDMSKVKDKLSKRKKDMSRELSKEGDGEDELSVSPERGGGQRQPEADTASNVDMSDIIDNMPDDHRAFTKQINTYLDKLQYIALARAEKMLKSPDKYPPSELIKLATQLKDLQLTIKWTRKLETAIYDNPSKLLPTGQRGGFSLLSKLKEMSSSAKKEVNLDKRRSGLKQSQQIINRIALPRDDERVSG